ncbi:PRD domain-containing protein [Enterococcus gilvus]|uniref:PRD domain-containing protein n=1 Tax=Enterococcus gilvus TaxID=160453 RepID=UPI0029137C98|nr:PRD domain-containing protein [Enterococcus gilvus]MDU5510527.1 PRD domain-containing protein [Enterococcus gilvus]
MIIIKKINNNVAIGLDNNHREIVVIGKGIGFGELPYELSDLSKIDRTYYDIDKSLVNLTLEIPDELFGIVSDTVEKFKAEFGKELNPNIVFTLSDHINFGIERAQTNLTWNYSIQSDIEVSHPTEIELAKELLFQVNNRLNVSLPNSEIYGIALHLINAQKDFAENVDNEESDVLIRGIIDIVETFFKIELDKKSMNYVRFVTHLNYLFKQKKSNNHVSSENIKLYKVMKKDFPNIFECVLKIQEYLNQFSEQDLNDEDRLYLMLHLNRVLSREDYYC